MNRLTLTQRLREEAIGPSSLALPVTTINQTGQLKELVNYIDSAWREIQNQHADWRWKRRECTYTTGVNVNTIAPTAFTDVIATTVIANFSSWVVDWKAWSCYTVSGGQGNEAFLQPIFDYGDWRWLYDRGNNATMQSRPIHFSVAPNDYFKIGPRTLEAMVLRGWYQESAIDLALDADIPSMPVQYHEAIMWRALMMWATSNAASEKYASASENFTIIMNKLDNNQLPAIRIRGPLA